MENVTHRVPESSQSYQSSVNQTLLFIPCMPVELLGDNVEVTEYPYLSVNWKTRKNFFSELPSLRVGPLTKDPES